MLAHVPAELAELRVLLDEPLHVADRIYRLRVVREGVRLVRLDVGLERGSEVAERRKVVCLEEGVGGGRESDFLRRLSINTDVTCVYMDGRHTFSSGRMSGTRLRSTRPFCTPRSSCTIA